MIKTYKSLENFLVVNLMAAAVATSIAILSPVANAACTTTGTVVNCTGLRDASHEIDYRNTNVDTIVVDPGAVLTSANNGPLIRAEGIGDLNVTVGSGVTATGATNGSVANPSFVVQVIANGGAAREASNINILVEEDTLFTTGTGGQSAGVQVIQDLATGDVNVEVRGEMNTSTLGTENNGAYYHNEYILIFSAATTGNVRGFMNGAKYTSGSAAMPGTNSHAVHVLKLAGQGDAIIDIVDSSVDIAGSASHGAYVSFRGGAMGNAIINLDNSVIDILQTSPNFDSYGVYMRNYIDNFDRLNVGDSIVNIVNTTINLDTVHNVGSRGVMVHHSADGDAFIATQGSTINVNSKGDSGAGIWVEADNDQTVANLFVNVGDNTTINFDSLAADDSAGVMIKQMQQGDITYNQGAGSIINATGDFVSGVVLEHTGDVAGNITAQIAGEVSPTGADADGLRVSASNDSTYSIVMPNGGILRSGSGNAAAAKFEAPGGGVFTIESGAVVDGSGSGTAIRDGDADDDGVDEIGGDIIIENSGEITGDVVMGLGDDTFFMTGGAVNGDIYGDDAPELGPNIGAATKNALGQQVAVPSNTGADGDDLLVFSGGTFNGTFYGQGGADTVIITGAPNYTGNEVFDGGEGNDSFIFENIDLVAKGENIISFENVIIDGGTVSFLENQLITENTTITNNGVLDAGTNFALMSDLLITNGGVFDGTGGGAGIYELTGDVVNDGFIRTADGVVGDKINITGNYIGNGILDVDVDTDTETADQLIISGDSTGAATLLRVTNAATSGVGRGTGSGIGVGIPVVLVGGAAADGDFALEEDLIAGAFNYKLNREGDNVFYLQSELLPQVVAAQAVPSVMRSSVTTVPSSPIRQTASLNNLRQSTLLQRVGECNDHDYINQKTGNSQSNCHDSYSWIRIEKSELDMNLPQVNRQSYDETQRYVHFGHDVELSALTGGQPGNWFIGFNSAFGDSDLTVQGKEIDQRAAIDKEFAGFGISATRYGKSGVYNDFILQYTDHDTEIISARGDHNVDGQNVAASAEIGKKMYLNNDKTWSLTPQAQIIHSRTDFDAYQDDDGVVVSNDDGETTTSRLGLLLEKRQQLTQEMKQQGQKPSSGYIIANVYANLDNKTSINASGTHLEYEDHDSWVGLGVGGNANLRPDVALFGEVTYNQSLDDFGDSEQISGTIGLRKTWKADAR